MISFSGEFQGRALQPVAEQGRPPWGRTRNGGGFPVVIQQQEEDAAATPVIVEGTPLQEVQPAMFALVAAGDFWAPTFDLALPSETPQPLSAVGTARPTEVAAGAPPSGNSQPAEVASTLDSFARWFYVLPVLVALLALYRWWQERKQGGGQMGYTVEEADCSGARGE
jgi:hypothetical protein